MIHLLLLEKCLLRIEKVEIELKSGLIQIKGIVNLVLIMTRLFKG